MNTHAIKLDIDKRRAVLEPIVIAQGDKNGTTIQATIYDAGTLVTTQGLTARFRMRLPDGRHFYEKTATWSYSTGTASVTIDETQAASVAGTTHECYFVLLNGSTIVYSTSRFAIRVLRDATDGIAATSYSDRLEDLLDELGDLPLPADTAPVMDGNAYKGSSTRYARQDHRHPTDTTRAPLASPALTGSPTAPTPAQGDDGTRIATTHWVRGMASTSSPAMDGSASYGSSAYYARADHRHPTDTTRAAASDLATHMSDSTAHVTDVERSVWDAKASTDTATNVTNGLMSASDKVKLDGIDQNANAYSLPPATDSSLGGVIPDGTTITVDPDGTIHGASTYELPTMSNTTKGGAILGHGLEITDGVLSVATEGDGAIRSVTAEGWATQDTTVGKNLLPKAANGSSNGVTWTVRDDGTINVSGTQSGGWNIVFSTNIALQSGTYTLSARELSNNTYVRVVQGSTIIANITEVTSSTFALSEQATVVVFAGSISIASGMAVSGRIAAQLEVGSTATEYEPYTGGAPSPSPDYPQEIQVVRGHEVTGKTGRFVDLEVRDANNQLLSTIPIPLPSKGFAASLPDGTHDTLTIDGAGHVEWTNRCGEKVFDGSSDESWSVNDANLKIFYAPIDDCIMYSTLGEYVNKALCSHFILRQTNNTSFPSGSFKLLKSSAATPKAIFNVKDDTIAPTVGDLKTWLAENPVTVLYPLASPTTEDMGYVDLAITTEGDTVSIPELEDVAVVRWADAVATEVAQAWYRRAQAVETRVAALEQAVAELVANG